MRRSWQVCGLHGNPGKSCTRRQTQVFIKEFALPSARLMIAGPDRPAILLAGEHDFVYRARHAATHVPLPPSDALLSAQGGYATTSSVPAGHGMNSHADRSPVRSTVSQLPPPLRRRLEGEGS
jgi:hypothetical protein